MKTRMTINKQAKLLAGALAISATTLTIGGPLTLAEHYAQTGASVPVLHSGSDYAQHDARTKCPRT